MPVFQTNVVAAPVTNLVAKPEAEATIQAAGSVVNTFFPGIGSIVALALGGLYHGYRQVRNRKVNEALVQGVETVVKTPASFWCSMSQRTNWASAAWPCGVVSRTARAVSTPCTSASLTFRFRTWR